MNINMINKDYSDMQQAYEELEEAYKVLEYRTIEE
jgi:hypothetical protein